MIREHTHNTHVCDILIPEGERALKKKHTAKIALAYL